MPAFDDVRDYEDFDDARDRNDSSDRGFDDFPSSSLRRRSEIRRWLLYLTIGFVGLPFTCCGGLLFLSMTYKTFAIKNAQHLGGSAVHLTFEYEVKTKSHFLDDSFKIVAETADSQRAESPVPTSFRSLGRFVIHRTQAGPAEESKSPVKVWIEHSGGRRASNVLTVPVRTN